MRTTFRLLAGSMLLSGGYALTSGTAAPPLVSVHDVNAGAVVERDLCLTVALGAGAASECGDLRLAHALPTVRTLNQARTPVLIYNSQHARPHALVAANVTLPQGKVGLQRVTATLLIDGRARAKSTWSGDAWPAGPARIALGFDAQSEATGVRRFVLEVSAVYTAGTETTRAAGALAIVNRKNSPFGAGWWLAGLEQLVLDTRGNPVLRVGGDGSVRPYSAVPGKTDRWAAPAVDRPDTLMRVGSTFERKLTGGARVIYDAGGRHVATRSRIGYETSFAYTDGRLSSVSVPPSGSGLSYRFLYGADGFLQRVEAPGVQGTRNVILTRTGDELSIQDPDLHRVVFTHADGTRRRIVARRNRLGHTTHFDYDVGGKIAASRQDMAGGTSIVMRLTALESLGLATAVDTAQAYALLDGPRTDVADHTRLWLDRWGAPRRIIDAAGRETLLTRGDPRFPALVTRVDGALRADGKRRTLSASYDARGNLQAQTDSSTSDLRVVFDPVDGHASNQTVYATTRYAYEDPLWPDLVTRIVLPEGETTTVRYDAATGLRLWQQVGPDSARRVRFAYYGEAPETGYARGLLKAVVSPAPPPIITPRRVCSETEPNICTIEQDTTYPPAPVEKVEYDGMGNLRATISALEIRTEYLNDALGRPVRIRSPVDESRARIDTTGYDGMGRITYQESRGPQTFSSTGALLADSQKLIVRTAYDANGSVLSVMRRSVPDVTAIDSILTRWEYDVAGRDTAEVAADGRRDLKVYDAAGNVERVLTRRGDTLRTRYDALNRPVWRYHSATRYGTIREGIPALTVQSPSTFCTNDPTQYQTNHLYPQYPTRTEDCSLTVPADSSNLEYDVLGNLKRADNSDARVRRGYNLNGTLAWDSLQIRTLNGAPGDAASLQDHTYWTRYEYDLNGRRTGLIHPAQLAQGTTGITRYTYAPGTGEPDTITDPLGNVFDYSYTARGQLESVSLPGAVQGYSYDADGQLARSTLKVPSVLTGFINDTRFAYDLRGKMTSSRNEVAENEYMAAQYSGLGYLVEHHRNATGASHIENTMTQASSAWYEYDAMGNVRRTVNGTNTLYGSLRFFRQPYSSGTTGGPATYQAGTGRQLGTAAGATDTQYRYDAAGNVIFEMSTGPNQSFPRRDRASYYGSDGLLRTLEARDLKDTGSSAHGTWEEYRYDALGRRVWVRTRRFCAESHPPQECSFSTVRRVVWDGDQVLHEIRMADTDAQRESDGAPTRQDKSAEGWDPNPGLGRVLLTHGLGLDQPLSAIRMGYREWGGEFTGAFSVVPLWDSRGRAPYAVFGNGRRELAWPGVESVKLRTYWLLAWHAYGARNNALVLSTDQAHAVWMGNVMEDQQDASGLLYRRNRYYNPASGRFTQEDPIGLAGGINLYGFANGDPVGYSDPYGLCPPEDLNLLDCPPGFFTAVGAGTGGTIGGISGGIGGGGAGAALCAPSGPVALVCGGAGAAAGAVAGARRGAWLGGRIGAVLDGAILAKRQADAVADATSLVPQIQGHLQKLGRDPNGNDSNHWRGEIRGWLNQVEREIRHMGRRTASEWRQFVHEARQQLDRLSPD